MPEVAAPPDVHVLRARGLRYSYDGSPALQSVSLGVRAGETVAVTGPRGSGKTTLLSCLSGQLPCMGGGLWFDGVAMHTMGRSARERLRRERFGWVGSRPQLIPELTAWENVALPQLLCGTGRKAARKAACEWLDRLDVGGCARKRPDAMRRSECQRVALARALAHSPAVLFADEPDAPLHLSERIHVLRTLTSAARSHGITVVLSTHLAAPEAFPVQDSGRTPESVKTQGTALTDRVLTLVDGLLSGPGVPLGESASGEVVEQDGAGAEEPAAAEEAVSAAGREGTGPEDGRGGERKAEGSGPDDGSDSEDAECSLSV